MTAVCDIYEQHAGAINFDLLTMTRYKSSDIPHLLTWADLRDFILYLPATSATFKETNPKHADWYSGVMTPNILADLYDAINYMISVIAAKNTKKKPKVPRPYKRPWLKDDSKKYGSGAIPIDDFNEWYYSDIKEE